MAESTRRRGNKRGTSSSGDDECRRKSVRFNVSRNMSKIIV